MDTKSIMGYANNSPYRNSPYLDIETPEGLITMENTDIDLLGIDNTGHTKVMKANSKEQYKFPGTQVREIPMKKGGYTEAQYNTIRGLKDAHDHGDFDNISPNKARKILHDKKLYGKKLTPEQVKLFGYLSKGNTLKFKTGGMNPYQEGGMTDELVNYLFDEEGDDDFVTPQAQTPQEDDNQTLTLDKTARIIRQREADELALGQVDSFDNPYRRNPMDDDFGFEEDVDEPFTSPATYSGQLQKGFRSFSTPEEGWNALRNQLDLYKTGRTRNPVGPNSTLLEAMSVYAPAADKNNPMAYASTIARNLGISVNTRIANIDTDRWAKEIARVEGNKKGNNPGNLRPHK